MNGPGENAFDAHDTSESPIPNESPEPPARKGYAALAWLAIAGLVALAVWRNADPPMQAAAAPNENRFDQKLYEIQGRYLLGAAEFPPLREQSVQQARKLDRGDLEQRLRFLALVGELAGPREALERLDALAGLLPSATNGQRRAAAILERLYRDYDAGRWNAPSVAKDERAFLQDQLGWFGRLALYPKAAAPAAADLAAPAGAAPAIILEQRPRDGADNREEVLSEAHTTFAVLLGGFCSASCLGLIGFAGLLVFLILATQGKLQGGMFPPHPRPLSVQGEGSMLLGGRHGGVYAETFAVHMALFFGLSYAFMLFAEGMPVLVKVGVVAVLSLTALVWPVARGIRWRRVREEIGWTLGRQPLIEPFWGIACYVMALPLVAVGIFVTVILILLGGGGPALGLGDANLPRHPIVDFIASADADTIFWIFLNACVLAPVVEETMFRGVLYWHLREWSRTWRFMASVLFSALVTGVIFAAVHPQGMIAVPALAALSLGFVVAREWRGSLMASMTAHGMHNGLMMTLALLLLK
ncbi:MAG: CPBP family intramembrane metalloprotease [Gemmataceae bacterium]|nr:CPBP family intramembrane metalloprotease [Gemmataceae bacterium]